MQYLVPQRTETCFLDGRQPRLRHFDHRTGRSSRLPRAMHLHANCAEISFVYAGNGVHAIGDDLYHSRPGDVLLYNAGVPHDERAAGEEGLCCYTLGVTALRLRGLPENAVISARHEPLLHAGEAADRLRTLGGYLHEELLRGRPLTADLCRHFMMTLLFDTLELIRTRATLRPCGEEDLALRIKRYIDARYRENLTLTELSEALGASAYHLGRTFKERTGHSPVQYIIQRRMGEAQTLLTSTEASVISIAEGVGYENANYFNLLFKKHIGVTPGQYRKITRECQ